VSLVDRGDLWGQGRDGTGHWEDRLKGGRMQYSSGPEGHTREDRRVGREGVEDGRCKIEERQELLL
jgi:hypothetical protein